MNKIILYWLEWTFMDESQNKVKDQQKYKDNIYFKV